MRPVCCESGRAGDTRLQATSRLTPLTPVIVYALFILFAMAITWAIWHRLNQYLYNDAFSPFNLLFYFWVAPFLLSFANLSALQTGTEPNAVGIVVVCTVALALTSLLPAMLISRSASKELRLEPVSRVRPSGPIVFYFITLLAIYFAEFRDQDLPLIAYLIGGASDSNLHTFGKDSKLQIIASGIYSAAICIFYFWLHEKRRLRRVIYLSLCLLVIALGLFKASKSDIYIPILSYGGLLYYFHKTEGRTLPKSYIFVALTFILVVIFVTSIRLEGIGLSGGYAGLIEFKYSEQLGPVVSEITSIIYGYMALGFQNFSNYVNTHSVEVRIGTSLFRPVLSIFMMGSIADANGVPVDEWNVVSDAANTGTFLTPLYIEGGFLFCVLGSVIYGLLVNLAYFCFRSARSVRWMLIYTSLLFPWSCIFFTNAFSALSVLVNLFYAAVLSALFMTGRRQKGITIDLNGLASNQQQASSRERQRNAAHSGPVRG